MLVKFEDEKEWNEKMNKYTKTVEILDTGMVTGEVHRTDGRRVGLKFFDGLLSTHKVISKRCKKAHQWCDAHIKLCQDYET